MNALKTTFLMALLMVLAVFIGYAIGGNGGMMIAFIFALGMNLVSYWFSDKIVLKMYKAEEITESASPRLFAVVRDLSQRAGLPMPKVYLIPTDTPNAFATGRNPAHAAVAVTRGIMNILTENELRGVLGHELAHVKHRDILIGTIAAVFAGAISMLAHMAQWAAIFGGGRSDNGRGGGGLGLLAMAIVAPIAALLIQMAISRSREYLADEGGARFHGNPRDLASALAKLQRGAERMPMQATPATAHMFIVNPLTGRGLMSLFSTHPPMEERIKRLEAMRF
ncbi:MAG: zinc metalloprotease HtpX [Candidatus Zixiibacteriota bacterium]|nr:MAG: zinc metalloprotease HtpX [candidate division Zixibacteria bacterium]